MINKIYSYKDVDEVKTFIANKEVVLVGGCFDIYHYGHNEFLKKAKEAGNVLIVALESDKHILEFKKRTPFHTQQQRAEIIASLEMVDFVVKLPFFSSDNNYLELVKKIMPKYIAITKDDKNKQKKVSHAMEVGASVIEVTSFLKNFSSGNILKNINLLS